MSRTIAIAVLTSALATAATAAPQLVVPNLNPGLKTVPFVPQTAVKPASTVACAKTMVARIDSGTVITGADGKVAHITGMTSGDGDAAELVVTATSTDGLSITTDFVACAMPYASTYAPVATSLPLSFGPKLKWITVRAQANTITLKAR